MKIQKYSIIVLSLISSYTYANLMMFKHIDSNGDDKISIDEFKSLDKDSDGFIDHKELFVKPDSATQSEHQGKSPIMDRFDKDGDGKLSSSELPNARILDRYDTNGDGYIDAEEAEKIKGRGGRGRKP